MRGGGRRGRGQSAPMTTANMDKPSARSTITTFWFSSAATSSCFEPCSALACTMTRCPKMTPIEDMAVTSSESERDAVVAM